MTEEKENIVEEVTNEVTSQENETTEQVVEQPIEEVENKIDLSKFDSADNPDIIKVDLSNPPTTEQPVVEEKENLEEVVEEVNQPVVEEVVEESVEDKQVEEVKEAVEEAVSTGKPLPENIQKLVDFMEDTGGDVSDYVNLNRDVSKMDDSDVLDEYYRTTKSHLSAEERSFLLEDTFGVDEDMDDDKTIRKKKIALKEQVAEARAYLDGQKSKYYEDIKAGSKLTPEQQKAIDFFNRYNKEQTETEKVAQQQREAFTSKTNQLFNDKFKGFEYNIGDKRFRFNVKDATQVKENQSDINNFVSKFMDKKQQLTDPQGYHKSLFTAMNADAVANHFYQQGKADAIKDSIAKAKNITTEPRQGLGEVQAGGVKVRVLSGDDSNAFKFKLKK